MFTAIGVLAALSMSLGLLVQRGAFDTHLIALTLGAFLAILTLGSGLGWAASRCIGISAPLAVGGALALLNGLAIVGACSQQLPAVELQLQLAGFALASSILYRPLARWVGERSGPSFVSGTRGLSTIEYSVLFVLIVVGSLALWRKLASSLRDQVSTGQTELIRALSSANAKGNAPVALEPSSNVSKGSGAPNRPSAVAPGPGMSSPSAANPPGNMGSSNGQPGHMLPPSSIQTGAPFSPVHSPPTTGESGSMVPGPLGPPPDPVFKKPKRAAESPDETAKP